jgi:hypothetical protein
MERVYSEIGFGNKTFLSTEIESSDHEYRINRFLRPKSIDGYYIRIWVLKTVFIFSTNSGIKLSKKGRNALKILFGISGTN